MQLLSARMDILALVSNQKENDHLACWQESHSDPSSSPFGLRESVEPSPYAHTLEKSVEDHYKSMDKDDFISFLRFMMVQDPASRATAEELLKHKWLSVV